jgi:ABC-type uncharacterized transport system substrate-binding protein
VRRLGFRVITINKISVLCFLLLFIPSFLQGHPHIFIDNKVTIVFDEKGLAGFNIDWVFDKIFSASIIHDFDLNGDGIFSKKEIEAIKEGAFSNLSNFNYFCLITINGSVFRVQYVTDFFAAVSEKRVVYKFFVPCHVQGITEFKKVTAAVYDETYFTDIIFDPEEAVRIENGDFFEYSYTLAENKKRAYWGGQIIPTEIHLRFRKKK